MKFEYDILISFSGNDDKPLEKYQRGWVSSFQSFLEKLLTQLMGEKPKIIISDGNAPADISAKALTMISIISPDYVDSVPNVREAESFYRNLEKENALKRDGLNRIFKVLKSYVPSNKHPEGLRELIGYNLYNINYTTGESIEITDFFESDVENTYWLRLVDLAHDLYDIITISRDKKTEHILAVGAANECIYLANAARDLAVQRDVIKRELQRHGYTVLPNYSIPSDTPDIEDKIVNDLEKCKLSIHFISGSSYGKTDEKIKGLPEIQNEVAAKFSSQKNDKNPNKDFLAFPRFIWIPPDFRVSDEQQKIFIENFKRDAQLVASADVLSIPLEELKSIIRNELYEINARKAKSTSQSTSSTDSGKTSIYLICDKMDFTGGKKIADHLSVGGYEVIIPEFSGTILESRQIHQLNLNKCDAVLIYMSKVSEKWVNSKAHDVLKSPGFGRKKVMRNKIVLVEKGVKLRDHMFLRENDFQVLHNSSEFLSETLRPFTAKL
ncbi:MAG TPA: hypothetical protein VK766_00265 [Cytophagaceae bacterium]|jgi:hypothetical protein|nr:hypothetical protein [Cytophagaceae bacterium]